MNTNTVVRIAISGDSRVGKTSLCLRLVDKELPLTYVTTIGLDLEVKFLPKHGLKIHYWDLSGNRRYEPLSVFYLKNINILFVILVYSLEDSESINRISEIYSNYKDVSPSKKFIVVGTHNDSQNKHTRGIEFAEKEGLPHFLVDNKNNKGIDVLEQYILSIHSQSVSEPQKARICIENPCVGNKRDDCIIT